MKKVALVFVLAVLLPSLVLAWLAIRSLRDQQFLIERQQSLLDQRVTDALAQNISAYLAQRQREFANEVENLAANGNARTLAARFDDQLRRHWPLAQVGFCVTASGKILSPAPNGRPEAQMFRLDNSGFLGNREPVEVYWSANNVNALATDNASDTRWSGSARTLSKQTTLALNTPSAATLAPAPATRTTMSGGSHNLNAYNGTSLTQSPSAANGVVASTPMPAPSAQPKQFALVKADTFSSTTPTTAAPSQQQKIKFYDSFARQDSAHEQSSRSLPYYKAAQNRAVSPQSRVYQVADKTAAQDNSQENLSKVIPAEAEFRQLIGNQTDGMLARFLQNKLKLMFWHRLSTNPDLIFGAELNLNRVVDGLRKLVRLDPSMQREICLALLDDNARPVALSRAGFYAKWKQPFVATEIGDALPHWEAAAYLVNPAGLTRAARTAELTLGLFIALLVLAIGVGSWLIVSNLNAELKLARQKTDFVSNVSHELKTPLTSIRMFSELLADRRVTDATKQCSYLNIITAEAARLTRLINNVLDFSRMERGEKKYNFQPCDLTSIVRVTTEMFRPHLETNGFKFICEWPDARIDLRGDADALSQVIVNLLSNAEKYSNGRKEVAIQISRGESPLPSAEVRVLDRGPGVPHGNEGKIFEKFYRAHDSLSSGVQGSGLGLTIARQIARAHGGDVVYEPRAGGGSCFILRLPISTPDGHR